MNPKVQNIVKNFLNGTLRCAEFALTNACIAKCSFCAIWKQQPKIFVDTQQALAAIDRLADLGVSHLCLTGGEPLLHPDAVALVRRVTQRKINSAVLVAAPQLLARDNMAHRLAEAGADMISISFDSADPEVMARQRQIPNLMEEMEQGVRVAKAAGLKTMASVLIWNGNRDGLDALFAKARGMGFDFIAVNYPTFSESSTYTLGGEGIEMSKDHVARALERVIALKKQYPIINTARSMANIIRFLQDPGQARYPCLGGRRVLFVDWFFDVYPCMQLPDRLGNLFDLTSQALNMPPCNRCNMSWYRDLSAFFSGLRSLPVIWDAVTTTGKYL
jgi:MoaA/NifB/PqqE/SkfB family radical SAM enzyme